MTLPFIATMTLLAVAASACGRTEPAVERLPYPVAAKGDVVDDYAGTKVPDPYRWMEALDSKDVADWVAASNAVTDPYLAKLPLREHFNTRLTELWNYPRVGVPVVEGGKLFYAKNTGLQRQSPVFVRSSATAPPTLVIDPNVISEDGSVSLSQWSPSPDAKLLAYGLSEGGADWNTIRVRDIASGKDLPDEVQMDALLRASPGRTTARASSTRAIPSLRRTRCSRRRSRDRRSTTTAIGTPQSQDTLVYERKDLPAWIINGEVTEDGRYLLIGMFEGAENKNSLYYADLG